MKPFAVLLPIGLLAASGCSQAQQAEMPNLDQQPPVVPVGKGSYSAYPPPETAKWTRQTITRDIYITPDAAGKPIPTNGWWTNLIIDKYAGQIWAFPHQVKTDRDGFSFFFPTRWNDSGSDPVSEDPLRIGARDFNPEDARAKSWSDWLLTYRLAQGKDKYIDATLGRGMPYLWLEPHGVVLQLKTGNNPTFFSLNGNTGLPAEGDNLGITFGGRSYGVFGPAGTQFEPGDNNAINIAFPAGKQYLVIAPLPAPDQLAALKKYAFAIPRKTTLSYDYDPTKAQVVTKWHIDTEALQGTEKRVWQGWLPHHYRGTTMGFATDGPKYLTPRGEMRCAAGNDFTITYPFRGIPLSLPAPNDTTGDHPYQPDRMADYVNRYATRTNYGEDTYWGGKHLLQWGQYIGVARATKNDAAKATMVNNLRNALADWMTYTPGEKAHYFTRYPRWGAMIGINPSYGSESFNDQHFHYGYFTASAAMLGREDPQFLKDYGPMLEQVAREYANWDRDSKDFPFLRTFDIWEGHSWAGGFSGGTGNNQESSSEAMQSWAGLFWLGEVMGNDKMAAAGAMGYAMESRATQEYWFNQNGGNWSPNWKHDVVGMVWSGGNNYGTYFSGDPAWIWGIQWLPMTPALGYLVEDKAFAKKSFNQMWAARKAKEGDFDINKLGAALGNVILGQAAQANPAWVAQQMDELWDTNSPVAKDNDIPGLTYYLAHTNLTLGDIDFAAYTTLPLSRVYTNPTTKVSTYIVYNPTTQPVTAAVYRDGKVVGHLKVPANGTVETRNLDP